MNVIREICGLGRVDGDYAFENEVETTKYIDKEYLESDLVDSWILTKDGSLRNIGNEFVSCRPVKYGEVKNHVTKLCDFLKRLPVVKSDYTSIHIHKNVQEYTGLEVINLITAYWCIEDLLFKFYGDVRTSNCFCVRLSDSEEMVRQLVRDQFENKGYWNMFTKDRNKYGAVNLYSVLERGSLEFRGMFGSTKAEDMIIACDIIEGLSRWAKKFETPVQILDYVFNNGVENVYKEVYKEFPHVLEALNPLYVHGDCAEAIETMSSCFYEFNWNKLNKSQKRVKKAVGQAPLILFDDFIAR